MSIITKNNTDLVIHINPTTDYDVALPIPFSTAQYDFTLNELKALLLFIGLTQANTPEDEQSKVHEYTFYAGEMAAMMTQRDAVSHKSTIRPSVVANTFKSLQSRHVEISDARPGEDADNTEFISYALFSKVHYNGRKKEKPLTLRIDADLNQFFYESRDKIPYSLDEINAMSSLNSIRVFIYLITLASIGKHHVSIERFKHDLQFDDYDWKNLKKRVLRRAVNDIQTFTAYKDFTLTSDARQNTAATKLLFSFCSQPIGAIDAPCSALKELAPDIRNQLKEVSRDRQYLIAEAINHGYDPKLLDQLIHYHKSIGEMSANIQLAIDYAKRNKLSPKNTGAAIYQALRKNWASQPKNQKQLKSAQAKYSIEATKQNISLEDDIKFEKAYIRRAESVISSMTLEQKLRFVQENRKEVELFFGRKRAFDLENVISGDRRLKEYKALRAVIVQMLKNQDPRLDNLPTAKGNSLF